MSRAFAALMACALVLCGLLGIATPIDAADTVGFSPVSRYTPPENPHTVARVASFGTTVYTIDQSKAPFYLEVIDISNPAAPVRRARESVGSNGIGSIALDPTGRHLLLWQLEGLKIFDVTDSTAPREVGNFPSPIAACTYAGLGTVAAGPRFAYYTYGPSYVGASFLDATCRSGLAVVDLATPAAVGEWRDTGARTVVTSLDLVGSLLYAGGSGMSCGRYCSERGKLRVLDVSDPTAPKELSSVDSTLSYLNGVRFASGYMYAAGGWTCGGGTACDYEAKIDIVDVRDPARITLVGSKVTGWVNHLERVDNYLFVAEAIHILMSPRPEYEKGLRLFDLSNPLIPREVAVYGALSQNLRVSIASDHVLVADGGCMRILRWRGDSSTATPTTQPIPTLAAGVRRQILPMIGHDPC